MRSASDSTTGRASRPPANWRTAARRMQQTPMVFGLAALTVFDVSGFRFKGPRGVPTPVFLAIVVIIIAVIIVAIVRSRRRHRPGPPPDDWQRNRSTPGGRG
jgi:hypothetical protein